MDEDMHKKLETPFFFWEWCNNIHEPCTVLCFVMLLPQTDQYKVLCSCGIEKEKNTHSFQNILESNTISPAYQPP